MSFKPTRTFSAVEGDYSVDNAGPEALKADLDKVMKMFDPTATHSNGETGGIGTDNLNFNFADESMSASIGSEDIDGLTANNNVYAQLTAIVNVLLTHTNLTDADTLGYIGGKLNNVDSDGQSIIDSLYAMIVDRYSKSATESLIASNTNVAITSLSYDESSGKLTATTKGGTTTEVFDLNVEMIPVEIGFMEEDNTTYIYIRSEGESGTRITKSNITNFVTQYSFTDSADIDFTVTDGVGRNKSVTATIKDGAVTTAKLDATIFSTMEGYATTASNGASSASTSASNASTSEGNARQSAINASGSASSASASAGSATNSASSASSSATTATQKATLAESYAHGGTNTREGEDTDNCAYYLEQCQGISGGDFVTHQEYNADMATVSSNIQSATNLASQADAKADAIGTYTVNGKQIQTNPTLSASDVSAVPTTRKVNGKALSSNVTLSASDVGAVAKTDFTTESNKVKSVTINNNTYKFSAESVYVGDTQPTDEDIQLWIDPTEEDAFNVVDNLNSDCSTDMLSAKQGKVLNTTKADKTQLSNRNLLDNAWFTINQRGQSVYEADHTTDSQLYCVDRWKIQTAHTLTVLSEGVKLTTGASGWRQMCQFLPNDFANKTVTFSIIVNNEIYTTTTIIPPTAETVQYVGFTTFSWGNVFISIHTTGIIQPTIDPNYNTELTIRAVKLEVGSISTLHLDAPPNYAEELVKCQRYFLKWEGYYMTPTFDNGERFGWIPFPVTMYRKPSITDFKYVDGWGVPTVYELSTNGVCIKNSNKAPIVQGFFASADIL